MPNIPVKNPHTFSEWHFQSVDIQSLIDDLNDVTMLGSIFVAYVLINLKAGLARALTPGMWPSWVGDCK